MCYADLALTLVDWPRVCLLPAAWALVPTFSSFYSACALHPSFAGPCGARVPMSLLTPPPPTHRVQWGLKWFNVCCASFLLGSRSGWALRDATAFTRF